VASRFYRWRKAGLWEHLFAVVQQQADANGHRDWDIHHALDTKAKAASIYMRMLR